MSYLEVLATVFVVVYLAVHIRNSNISVKAMRIAVRMCAFAEAMLPDEIRAILPESVLILRRKINKPRQTTPPDCEGDPVKPVQRCTACDAMIDATAADKAYRAYREHPHQLKDIENAGLCRDCIIKRFNAIN